MAEKEKRISIELLKDDFCDSCDNRGKLKNCCCDEKQEYDERYQKSLPRQEAIRKMCDAYFKAKDKGLMESERVVAALNALLSGEN